MVLLKKTLPRKPMDKQCNGRDGGGCISDFNMDPQVLLNEFRTKYQAFVDKLHDYTSRPTDTVVLDRFLDDIQHFAALVSECDYIFPEQELQTLQRSLQEMHSDALTFRSTMMELSHHGRPVLVEQIRTGSRGRPSIRIDRNFLAWAIQLRGVSGIAHFLGVGRKTVRKALLEYGLAEPQECPPALRRTAARGVQAEEEGTEPWMDALNSGSTHTGSSRESEISGVYQEFYHEEDSEFSYEVLEPLTLSASSDMRHSLSQESLAWSPELELDLQIQDQGPRYTTPQTNISDEDLDIVVQDARNIYQRAGLSMLFGILRAMGLRVSRERIRQSLSRIDPVGRVFDRIRIQRRVYSVPGPNALWHHDGQHLLIRWGIVIHGFIDGYSRLITALQASNNNLGETVLHLFFTAATRWGIPVRIRGDHGVENIALATWINQHLGLGRYIWGRSVHNIRIERLWVDVKAQLLHTWSNLFWDLEENHHLDKDNPTHLWLLHTLFLPILNQQLAFFMESWNHHTISIRGGRNRSPADMFAFDMLALGIRGTQLTPDELMVHGVDWGELRRLTTAQREELEQTDNIPDHLNEVSLEPPPFPILQHTTDLSIQDLLAQMSMAALDYTELWLEALEIVERDGL